MKTQPPIRRTDANQSEIVEALRKAGASVQSIHVVGQGVPDLLVGWHGKTLLIEVKAKGGKLTKDELTWLANWRGQAVTVHSIDEALEVLR